MLVRTVRFKSLPIFIFKDLPPFWVHVILCICKGTVQLFGENGKKEVGNGVLVEHSTYLARGNFFLFKRHLKTIRTAEKY